jgi:Astacin (Peptidase family M12A)
MKIVENSTCIKFINHTNEKDFVRITGNSYHCGTKIGKRGGEQILSILDKDTCFRTVSIIHELMHIIGFHHMHLSANRDEFIQIIWENVIPEKFKKFRIKGNLQDVGTSYDYGSVMHYSQYAYSKNGRKTIIPLKQVEEGLLMGQRETLSKKDILSINRLYDCDIVNEIDNDREIQGKSNS